MRKRLPTLILFIVVLTPAGSAFSQRVLDLNGFRLGQHREVPYRELGEPDRQGDTTEEIEYDAFLLSEEPTLYMIFQYQKASPKVIWSIQITGANSKHDLGFRGLRMGDSPLEVEKQIGKPSKKIDVGEHGTRWEFEKSNFSIEMNRENKLSSIRIGSSSTKEPDLKRLPKFSDVMKSLVSGTNAELADLLAPDIEVYEDEKVHVFENSMKNEIARDTSGVFAAIRRLSKELAKVDVAKPDQYEENMRLRYPRDPLHVIKLWKLRSVNEIAFQWNDEKWQIWEIGSKKEAAPPQDWKTIYAPGSLEEVISKRIPELIKKPNVDLKKDNGKPYGSFSYNSYPASTRVTFSGETKKVTESTHSLIALWLTTIGKPKQLADNFEYEVKVVEGGKDYWLPVQKLIWERLRTEARKGDQMTIYFAWVGIRYENDRPEILAIINEFSDNKKAVE